MDGQIRRPDQQSKSLQRNAGASPALDPVTNNLSALLHQLPRTIVSVVAMFGVWLRCSGTIKKSQDPDRRVNPASDEREILLLLVRKRVAEDEKLKRIVA